jgi:hypothetical protein
MLGVVSVNKARIKTFTHLHIKQRVILDWVELYLHSPVRLHDVVLS